MNIYIFLKVCGELFLYFAFLSGIPGLFPITFAPAWPVLICGAATGMAAFVSDHGKSGVRFACLLFPVCSLAFATTVMDLLVLIPPVIYLGSMMIRDEWDLEYFHFREFFRKSLTVLGIFLLVIFFGSMLEDSTGQRDPLLNSTGTLRYAILYLIIGILLQRQLRMGNHTVSSRYVSNTQMVLVSLSTALFLLAILGTERYLASQGISLGNLIGEALRFAVGLPVYLISILVLLVMGLDGKTLEKIESEQSVETQPIETNPLPEMGEAIIQQPEVTISFPWWLAVLILAALTVALILLTRMLRSRPAGTSIQETVEKLAHQAKQPKKQRRSNRQKVRKMYREYLKTEQNRGHRILPWHTSADILKDGKSSTDPEAAARLRQVYLSARYDVTNSVSSAQVQSAKDALKKIQ